MIVDIKATFNCDDCGACFSVTMDPAAHRPAGWSLFEDAEDFLRGGGGVFDKNVGGVEGGRHLCWACITKADGAKGAEA